MVVTNMRCRGGEGVGSIGSKQCGEGGERAELGARVGGDKWYWWHTTNREVGFYIVFSKLSCIVIQNMTQVHEPTFK